MPYKVYAALSEDINSGWVWVAHPEVPSRTVVRIVNQSNGKDIYCEALAIEPNFVSTYDSAGGTCPIKGAANAIVINAWYRMRLGDIRTQSSYDLTISPAENLWGRMQACIQHPQVVVRLSTWLGILGLCLGIVGVGLGILPFLLTR
jgi:hypothetical protein